MVNDKDLELPEETNVQFGFTIQNVVYTNVKRMELSKLLHNLPFNCQKHHLAFGII